MISNPIRRTTPSLLASAALLLGSLLCGSAMAQQQPATGAAESVPSVAYRITARSVAVDIVVTDRNGKPVSGLPKNAFSIFENNTPQTVLQFEEHHAPTALAASSAAVQPASTPLPSGTYINAPLVPPGDSVNILLLDALNTPLKDQAYVREEMIRYLKTIPPGTRIGIFTLASRLRLVQGITQDSSELLAALSNKKHPLLAQQSSLLNSAQFDAQNNQQVDDVSSLAPPSRASLSGSETSLLATTLQQFNADLSSFQYDMRVRITLDALAAIGRYLSPIPGRKNLIWLSGSFPLTINADPDVSDPFQAMRNYSDEVRQTTDLLSAAQVAIYPIDARGLMTIPSYDASHSGPHYGKSPTSFNKDLINFSNGTAAEHATMEQIAAETGGHAIYSSNDLKGALASVVNSGANFYTISYTPKDTHWDGRFRHIKVQVAESGYLLQYRRGYYADDSDATLDRKTSTPQDRLALLMSHGLPDFSQITYKMQLHRVSAPPIAGAPSEQPLKRDVPSYVIDYAVLMKDLNFQASPDGLRHGVLQFSAIAFDREGNQLNGVSQRLQFDLKPATYSTYHQMGLQYTQQLDVPAASAYLRTGVLDPSTGKIGTYEIPLSDLSSPVK